MRFENLTNKLEPFIHEYCFVIVINKVTSSSTWSVVVVIAGCS